MVTDGGFNPENVARLFVEREEEIVRRGGTVAEFARRGKETRSPGTTGAEVRRGLQRSGTRNGAVMRIAPCCCRI